MTDRVPVETVSPFQRLAKVLSGIDPGKPPISLAVGEPQHPIPDFVGPVIAANLADFGRYPATTGSEAFRAAVGAWLDRRYDLRGTIDPASMVVVLNGSREGLFLAGLGAKLWYPDKTRPVVLTPNPFYQAYRASALATGDERIAVACTDPAATIPDYGALPTETLDRTIAVYVASPANPQGSVATTDDWKRLIALARKHRFMVLADECYSEIYRSDPPAGALAAAHETGDFSNVVAFHSLSKRSNLPGLRVGFAAGDAGFLRHWAGLRAFAAPQVPLPLQAVAIAAYGDETHVAANRALYNEKYAAAERVLGSRFGRATPPGGFFLWLDMSEVGGGEEAAIRLWRDAGVRTVPGGYLALPDDAGTNPADPFLRVAMVPDVATITEALTRLVTLFPSKPVPSQPVPSKATRQ